MKRMQLIAAALCLIMIVTVGAGVVVAKQDENPSHAGKSSIYSYDVAATDTHGKGKLIIDVDKHTFVFNGQDFEPSAQIALRARAADDTDYVVFAAGQATPSGNLHLAGTWTKDAAPADVVRGTYYSGTIERPYPQTPCYKLTYTDYTGTHTVWLPPEEIVASGTNALPSSFPTPTAVAVAPLDDTRVYLVYQGFTYTVPTTHASCPGGCCWNPPYIWGDANVCQHFPSEDKYFGTVYLYTWDSLQNKYVTSPIAGVQVKIHIFYDDNLEDKDDTRTDHVYTVYTDSNGYWERVTYGTYDGADAGDYAAYSLAGYPTSQESIDHAPFCKED